MTTPDREPEVQPSIFQTFFGHITIPVSKIRPRIQKETDGGVSFDVDLNHEDAGEALDQLTAELNKPRLRGFKEKILSGHGKAWYSAVFGGITIVVVSTVAGVEFARHGKDIQRLFDIIEEHNKNKQK